MAASNGVGGVAPCPHPDNQIYIQLHTRDQSWSNTLWTLPLTAVCLACGAVAEDCVQLESFELDWKGGDDERQLG